MPHLESDPASDAMAYTGQGVGARLLRKEDDRFMRGAANTWPISVSPACRTSPLFAARWHMQG